jgi:hypothetical protein
MQTTTTTIQIEYIKPNLEKGVTTPFETLAIIVYVIAVGGFLLKLFNK